jgi:multicomponent Na+:H+ antiporter subunit F
VNGWLLAALILLVGGLPPGLYLGSRGDAVDRLVGLQLTSATAVGFLMVFAYAYDRSSYLILPLVLALLSLAGTLVFTRLLGRSDR